MNPSVPLRQRPSADPAAPPATPRQQLAEDVADALEALRDRLDLPEGLTWRFDRPGQMAELESGKRQHLSAQVVSHAVEGGEGVCVTGQVLVGIHDPLRRHYAFFHAHEVHPDGRHRQSLLTDEEQLLQAESLPELMVAIQFRFEAVAAKATEDHAMRPRP